MKYMTEIGVWWGELAFHWEGDALENNCAACQPPPPDDISPVRPEEQSPDNGRPVCRRGMSQIGKKNRKTCESRPASFPPLLFLRRFCCGGGGGGSRATAGGGPSVQEYHPESADVFKTTASGTVCHSFHHG